MLLAKLLTVFLLNLKKRNLRIKDLFEINFKNASLIFILFIYEKLKVNQYDDGK